MPPAVVTVTLRAPRRGGGNRQRGGDLGGAHHGDVADRNIGRGDIHRGAGAKFVPVRVTGTLAPWTPLAGAIAVRVGAAALTVKTTGAVVPPVVVTVTLRAPVVAVAAMVNVAVIWVALTTVTLLTVISAERHSRRRRKRSSCR